MKTLYYIIILIIVVGCSSDRLDLYPITQPTNDTFYTSEEELEQSLNEVYRQLGIVYDATGLPDIYGEAYSDNTYIKATTGANNFFEQINEYSILTDNGLIENAWENAYKAIFICNNIIEMINNTPLEINETKKNIMISQALAVRALVYFNIVRVWGKVPYVEETITPEESYAVVQTEPNEIYKNIIQDLNTSKPYLPEAYDANNVGRITKYGVSAILAKIYLTLGNNPAAKSELEFIINSNRYSLDANEDGTINIEDYMYLFLPETKNCKASILEIQYSSGINANNASHQTTYSPFEFDFHLLGQALTFRGEGFNTPTEDLAAEFEENDPRIEISVAKGYINLGSGNFVNYPYTLKFYDPNFNNPGQNFEIIRYADILLMYAEITNDATYLNMVRERVGLPLYGTPDYPTSKYPTLKLAIEHERRIELCFEFHRFFDLVRTNRAMSVMSDKGYAINQDKLIFPIPQNEIDINPNLEQNNGYK